MAEQTALPATKFNYVLTTAQQQGYAETVLLRTMAVKGISFPVFLSGDDKALEPILKRLLQADKVQIEKNRYVPSETGKKLIKQFEERYIQYLQVFDLYCAVDMAKGEFAFSGFFDERGENDVIWKALLAQERFEDLRVAVAEFKKANPVDVVFISFLNEGRFDPEKGWQTNLLLGDFLEEILKICNTNIHADQIEDVIEDVVKRGSELMFELLKQEQYLKQQAATETAAAAAEPNSNSQQNDVETVETVEYEIVEPLAYYGPYWDPFYISPLWTVPLWVLL